MTLSLNQPSVDTLAKAVLDASLPPAVAPVSQNTQQYIQKYLKLSRFLYIPGKIINIHKSSVTPCSLPDT